MHRTTSASPCSGPGAPLWAVVVAFAAAATSSVPCTAQVLDARLPADTALGSSRALLSKVPAGIEPRGVHWWEAALVAGSVAALLADDGHVLHEVREHPTPEAGDVANVFRQAGEVKVYAALSLGTLGVGLVAKDAGITRAGAQLVGSGALAAASFGLLKVVAGRSRPDVGDGAYEFHPFAGGGSFPSGHSAMAFALATTLGDASHDPWITAGLYMIATGTAWSRVYDQRHWPSDVLMGAALGVTSAKLVNGHWRIFGVRTPKFLVSPGTTGLQISF